ncbi:MAG: HAD family hydrolase [Armatimonadetes bacterium]|nr:HAD family hydrolase [Armatimonadota bacterium]
MGGEPRAAAFFDVDGTLVQGTVIQYYVWLVTRSLPWPARALRIAALATQLPRYWWLDRRGRDHFLRAFYRNYAGYRQAELAALQEALFQEVVRPRLHRQGEETVRAHGTAGRKVVILSASLRFVLEPLARHLGAEALICQELVARGGFITGELDGPPLNGTERARRLREYAIHHGIDLSASYAYGDSAGDIPMLAAVGRPVAVNPTAALRREAERRGWQIDRWQPRLR